jgi:hypothetical protein
MVMSSVLTKVVGMFFLLLVYALSIENLDLSRLG